MEQRRNRGRDRGLGPSRESGPRDQGGASSLGNQGKVQRAIVEQETSKVKQMELRTTMTELKVQKTTRVK